MSFPPMVMFTPGQLIKYSGSVCWLDGINMVTGDQLCLVVARRLFAGFVRYDVWTPKAFIVNTTLMAYDFRVV